MMNIYELKKNLEQIDMEQEVITRKIDVLKDSLIDINEQKTALTALITVLERKEEKEEQQLKKRGVEKDTPKNILTTEELQKFKNQPVSQDREFELDQKIRKIINDKGN